MKLMATVTSVSAFVLGLAFAGSASAQDCPHGDLDQRYCDADGDLVADIPTDASKLVDPDTLIFTYTPVEDPAVYKEVWAGFLEHMEEVTGKEVVFFGVQSNAAQIEVCLLAQAAYFWTHRTRASI
jgi:phosphonate transport system substrate-binding protein